MEQELSTGARIGLIIGSIFIPLLGIILGVIWMTDGNSSLEKKQFGKTILTIGIVITVLPCICYLALAVFGVAGSLTSF